MGAENELNCDLNDKQLKLHKRIALDSISSQKSFYKADQIEMHPMCKKASFAKQK